MFPGSRYFQVREWIVTKTCQKVDKNILILRNRERKDYIFQYMEISMVKMYMMSYTREQERKTTNSSQFNSLCIGILHALAPCSNSLAKKSLNF